MPEEQVMVDNSADIKGQIVPEQADSSTAQDAKTIESVLEKKLQSLKEKNPDGYQKLQSFFLNIQNSYPKNITDYLETKSTFNFAVTLSKITKDDVAQKRLILDELDSFYGKTELSTTQLVDTKISQVDTKISQVESGIDEFKKAFDNAKQTYQNIDNKFKPDANQQQQSRQELEKNGTLQKLKDKGVSEEQINDYVSFQYTSSHHHDALIQTDEGRKFLEAKQNIDTLMGIPSQPAKIYYGKDSFENTKKLVENNSSLQSYLKEQTPKVEQPNIENKEEINKLIEKNPSEFLLYTKFIDTKNLDPQTQKSYQEALEKKSVTDFPESIKQQLIIIKSSVEGLTQQTISETTLQGEISGISQYLDSTTSQKEYLGDSLLGFDLENSLLHVDGLINNKQIHIYHNIQTGELQTSDLFHAQTPLDVNGNPSTFSFGEKEGAKTSLNITTPGLKDISRDINNDTDTTQFLSSSDSLEEYQKSLSEHVFERTKKYFDGYKDLVKVRIEKQIQKDLAAQESVKLMNSVLDPDGKEFFDGQKSFSKETSNPQVFDFLKKLDYSLEDYSLEEMSSFRKSIGEFQSTVNRIKNHEKDGSPNKIRSYLNKLFGEPGRENSQDIVENKSTTQDDKLNISEFFNLFTEKKNSKDYINPEYLSKFVNEVQKSEPDITKLGESTYNQIVKKDEINETEKRLEATYE